MGDGTGVALDACLHAARALDRESGLSLCRARHLRSPGPGPPLLTEIPSLDAGDARAHAAAPDFRFVSLPARTDCLTGQRPGSPQSAFGLDMPVSFPPMMRLGKSLFLLTKADLVKVKLSGNIYIYTYFFFFFIQNENFPKGNCAAL